jgi:hypothetical protein
VEKRRVGNKIRGDENRLMIASRKDCGHKMGDRLKGMIRTTGNNLKRCSFCQRNREPPYLNLLTGGKDPVVTKNHLKIPYNRTPDLHPKIKPGYPLPEPIAIFIGNVNPPRKGKFMIHNGKFAMVPEIGGEGRLQRAKGHKSCHRKKSLIPSL